MTAWSLVAAFAVGVVCGAVLGEVVGVIRDIRWCVRRAEESSE